MLDRKRRSKPTRTGCRTCRIRKIKCDETRPICNKCSSTGRRCDGYEKNVLITMQNRTQLLLPSRRLSSTHRETSFGNDTCLGPGVNGLSWVSLGISVSPQNALTSFHQDVTPYEHHSFSYFYTIMFPKLHMNTERTKWTRVALQLSVEASPVFHAVAALGAVYRSLSQTTHVAGVQSMVNDERAIETYCSALRALRRAINRPDDSRAEIVLISCLLLLCFELVRENHTAALEHLHLGRRVARSFIRHDSQELVDNSTENKEPLVLQSRLTPMVRELAETFKILETNCKVSRSKPPIAYSDLSLLGSIKFRNLIDSRMHLDLLIAASQEARMELVQIAWDAGSCEKNMRTSKDRCINQSRSRFVDIMRHGRLFARILALIEEHQAWLTSYNALLGKEERPATRESYLQRIQHFRSAFLLSTCRSTHEKDTDRFSDDFSSVIGLAEHYLALTESHDYSDDNFEPKRSKTSQQHRPQSNLHLEPAVLPTLFLVALKSRSTAIRHRAIELLASTDRLEGFQKSHTLARFARKIIDLEEGRARFLSNPCNQESSREASDEIPEIARFLDVMISETPSCPSQDMEIVTTRVRHEDNGALEVTVYNGKGIVEEMFDIHDSAMGRAY